MRGPSLNAAKWRANWVANSSMSVRTGGKRFAKYRTSAASMTSPC